MSLPEDKVKVILNKQIADDIIALSKKYDKTTYLIISHSINLEKIYREYQAKGCKIVIEHPDGTKQDIVG